MSDPEEGVHWAPIVAVVACGSCLSSLAAGFTAFAAGFLGTFWAQWLPAAILLLAIAAWIGGVGDPRRRSLRVE